MDIQTLKLDLVDKIIKTDRPSVLVKISELFQKEKTEDWWEQLPHEVQESILDGMSDVKEGNVYSHEQVVREAKEKYGF